MPVIDLIPGTVQWSKAMSNANKAQHFTPLHKRNLDPADKAKLMKMIKEMAGGK